MAATANAGFTPGRYEIQNLGGLPIGTLAVSSAKATFDDKPATKVVWEFVYNREPFKSTEKHEAYFTKEGLWYFRKEVTDDAGIAITQGRLNADMMLITVDDHGRKYSMSAQRKDYVVTEYDIEAPASPFRGLKLKDAKSAGVLSVRELSAVSARRNFNKNTILAHEGKQKPTNQINTSFSKYVTTSWFTPDHVLLKEQWVDRQFVRVGD